MGSSKCKILFAISESPELAKAATNQHHQLRLRFTLITKSL